jgi:hypothetical protein
MRLTTVAGAIVVGFAVCGCQSFGGDGSRGGPTVSAVRHPTIEDFPLPSGFSLVSDNSSSRASGATRWVEYEFSGGTAWSTIIQFFKDTLPAAGWTLRTEQLRQGGTYEMRFDSSREECEVRVSRRRMKTLVNIEIRPKPQGSADRLPRPVQQP